MKKTKKQLVKQTFSNLTCTWSSCMFYQSRHGKSCHPLIIIKASLCNILNEFLIHFSHSIFSTVNNKLCCDGKITQASTKAEPEAACLTRWPHISLLLKTRGLSTTHMHKPPEKKLLVPQFAHFQSLLMGDGSWTCI